MKAKLIPSKLKLIHGKPLRIVNAFRREPVSASVTARITTSGGAGRPIISVASDKLLVIETVSAEVVDPDTNSSHLVFVEINDRSEDPNAPPEIDKFAIPLTKIEAADPSTRSGVSFVGTQSFRLYAKARQVFIHTISKRSYEEGGEVAIAKASLSGYLVPLDSPTLSP